MGPQDGQWVLRGPNLGGSGCLRVEGTGAVGQPLACHLRDCHSGGRTLRWEGGQFLGGAGPLGVWEGLAPVSRTGSSPRQPSFLLMRPVPGSTIPDRAPKNALFCFVFIIVTPFILFFEVLLN